jgi:hypothetical protein
MRRVYLLLASLVNVVLGVAAVALGVVAQLPSAGGSRRP